MALEGDGHNDLLRVQWGFDTVEGEVVEAYDSGFGRVDYTRL